MKAQASHDKRLEHQRQRRAHGLTYRQMEDEFGESKSNIHRKIAKPSPEGKNAAPAAKLDIKKPKVSNKTLKRGYSK